MNIEKIYDIFLQSKGVFTDSRQIVPGGIFFALKGDRFDGNRYAADALEKGAGYAVVDDASVAMHDRFILVKDVLETLQELARYHRRQFIIPVIAITGSNGKTTTKELVRSVMEKQYKVHYTKGNFNNHIGVPLTILAMPKSTEVFIVEMGANHQGEIAFLCQIAEPTHGLITNIGSAHLEGFGGPEGVKKGKGELFQWLAHTNGTAFINRNDQVLVDLADPIKKKIFYTLRETPDPRHPDMEIKLCSLQPFVKVAFLAENRKLLEAQSHLIGTYNFENLKTAIALGKYFKVPAIKIKQAIENFVPANNRSQLLDHEGNHFILDAYNANPSSMRQALINLGQMESSFKIAILGDMLELGDYTVEAHQKMVRFALDLDLERIILVGPLFAPAAKQWGLIYFEEVKQLKSWFSAQDIQGALILLKGSRGMRLEELIY